ncbi:hypothetical protein QBC32DRAFT_311275 [Pseudoneurospora amorphoporcata]|uniref:Riboflavin kinase n=1 Tax=Pseudoneurospora amorphoporcata TaxID=241081 RepID=A0AAN6P1Y3_9PEZI|nr:hypothetical protein QBC32DRAFT_311275 [Pseudoneurospora amorphoporcata]
MTSLPNPDNRPLLIGPPTGPETPFPFRMEGKVISGFGRGSKELGIPTANLPVDDETTWIKNIDSGIYFGWASLKLPASHPNSVLYQKPPTSEPVMEPVSAAVPQQRQQSELSAKEEKERDQQTGQWQIYPMVMSIGYNPFYKNTVRSAEVHVLEKFGADFYGVEMRLLITGFIRNEKDYSGLEALIADIEFDCEVARHSLARKGWRVRELGVVQGEEGGLDGGWLVR